jgi:hypothetical protein
MTMEAARTSETSVDNYFTRQYIQEDNSELKYACSPKFCMHSMFPDQKEKSNGYSKHEQDF